ncbi:MAG TPA: Na/Pi symporter, partial [Chitinophagales bacterium]|nr:Na/Pi symporter [Chitinophagales bacterium]
MNGEIWKFLAGLGLFIYSMGQLEDILKQVSGRSLKLFIRRNTQHLFKAIAIGTVLTAIAQSSSVVSLIVLAFVEAGIITFRNALAVILGTNLGTTMTGWIVATLGFKFDILFFSLPVIAISTLAMFLLRKNKSLFRFFSVLFALGMLFLSLSFIKESADVLVNTFPMEQFKSYPLIVFVLLGFLLTTIIQSSSATMAIALTAIYSGILSFPTAAALVIGSEVGTTMKILFWGVQGSVEKKRVAWGNFYYNIFTSVFAF